MATKSIMTVSITAITATTFSNNTQHEDSSITLLGMTISIITLYTTTLSIIPISKMTLSMATLSITVLLSVPSY